MTSDALRFTIVALDLFERDVHLRLPFRFGAVTVRAAPQAFVRARIRDTNGHEATGWTAELMVPKWFDKSPARSSDDNIEDLRRALALARDAYTSERAPRAAFAHTYAHYRSLLAEGAATALNPLVVTFGAALADRAVLDALCRLGRVSFAAAFRANLPALDTTLAPDLGAFDIAAFLAARPAVSTLAARHTVGLLDPLTAADPHEGPHDGLPVALDDVIARYGHRHFKLKLSGAPEADVERLARIAAVLGSLPEYAVTLDGNEQFADAAAVAEFQRALGTHADLARLRASLLYLEQPLPRQTALSADVRERALAMPLLIDESDDTFDAFPRAQRSGYTGVSSKNCKGPYKSLVNAARCAAAAPEARLFMSAEDLTTQCGLAVQQDLALAALVGVTHVERNGHHYVAGFAGQHSPLREQQAFAAAHPDLYDETPHGARLAIRDGRIAFASLDVVGYATGAAPAVDSLTPMATLRHAHPHH